MKNKNCYNNNNNKTYSLFLHTISTIFSNNNNNEIHIDDHAGAVARPLHGSYMGMYVIIIYKQDFAWL